MKPIVLGGLFFSALSGFAAVKSLFDYCVDSLLTEVLRPCEVRPKAALEHDVPGYGVEQFEGFPQSGKKTVQIPASQKSTKLCPLALAQHNSYMPAGVDCYRESGWMRAS